MVLDQVRSGVRISVIIPTLNEERGIGATLAYTLETLGPYELFVVDNQSTDATAAIAARSARVLNGAATRGGGLNAAAELATGDVLLFLHADTLLPPNAGGVIEKTLQNSTVIGGAFRLCLDDPRPIAKVVALSVNLRSAWLNTFFGDQAMFVRREVFLQAGGYREWSVMEDLEIIARLRRRGRLTLVDAAVVTSARRHRRNGWVRTIATIWLISLLFRLGVPGQAMIRLYRPRR
jgi:rSAM/selenodomain-associated transferase 2